MPITKSHAEDEEVHKEKVSKEDFEEVMWVTEFTEDSAREFCKNLLEKSEKDSAQPIVIYVDSYGGQIDALCSMITAIDSVPNKIVTVCMGKAMSAGAVLFSHGDIRYVSRYGRIMIHEAAGGPYGNINDVKVEVRELEIANESMLGLLANNCGKKLTQIKKLFTNKKREIYLGAEEAVAFGIAEKIGMPKITKVVKYEID